MTSKSHSTFLSALVIAALLGTGATVGVTTPSPTPSASAPAFQFGTIAIGGVPKVGGQPIQAVVGGVVSEGLTQQYQWYRDSTAITGQRANKYTPVAADFGKTLKVVVGFYQGTVKVGQTTATASAVQPGTIEGSVGIGGAPIIGGTLFAQLSGPAATLAQQPGSTVGYRWVVNGAVVSGAQVLPVARPAAGTGVLLEATVRAPGYTPRGFSASVGVAPVASTLQFQHVGPAQGNQRFVAVQPDTFGYSQSGTVLRYEWFRNGQLINVTGGPQVLLPSSLPVGSTVTVVQVASVAGYPEHRIPGLNRILVQSPGFWKLVS